VLRFDITTNGWVIFAPSRSMRPDEFRNRPKPPPATANKPCPFCPGNEGMTPAEVFATRESCGPNLQGWQVRMMPNMFPALRIEEDFHRSQDAGSFAVWEAAAPMKSSSIRPRIHWDSLISRSNKCGSFSGRCSNDIST